MFSEQQLKNFKAKPRITQDTFDAAVQENIEEFDMEPEEALDSAIAEFKAQGVDLSNIIMSTSGADVSTHPAAQAIDQLRQAGGEASATATALDSLNTQLASCSISASSVSVQKQQDANQLGAILLKADAVPALLECISSRTTSTLPEDSQLAALQALRKTLLLTSDQRAEFRALQGITKLIDALKNEESSDSIKGAALQVAAAAAFKDEDSKGALMSANVGSIALDCLQTTVTDEQQSSELICGACSVLTALTNADDETQPTSRAFPNARALAKLSAAPILASILVKHDSQPTEVVMAVLVALKQICANEEICKEAKDGGAVASGLDIVKTQLTTIAASSSSSSSTPANGNKSSNNNLLNGSSSTKDCMGLLRAALALLRQLASSDAVKTEIVSSGGLETARDVLDFSLQAPEFGVVNATPVPVMEHALGLLTNITLRNPEAATQAAECGLLNLTLTVMKFLVTSYGADKGGGLPRTCQTLRQGCMALRNVGVRSPELRQPLLDRGAEGILRAVKKACPVDCDDVGSAALRDLGVDHWNE